MVDSVEAVLRDGHRERSQLLVLLGERAVGEHLLADLAERAIDLHRRLQHQAVEPLLLRVALVDVHREPSWLGAPIWPPDPQRAIAGSPRPSNGLRLRTPTRPGKPAALLDIAMPSSARPRARRPSPAARRAAARRTAGRAAHPARTGPPATRAPTRGSRPRSHACG